jgi:hypothetical protein
MYNITNDNEIISFALELWGNYIETYSVSMSAKDMKLRESVLDIKDYVSPNCLTSYQKKLVEKIRFLSEQYKEKDRLKIKYEGLTPCNNCDLAPMSDPTCLNCQHYRSEKNK